MMYSRYRVTHNINYRPLVIVSLNREYADTHSNSIFSSIYEKNTNILFAEKQARSCITGSSNTEKMVSEYVGSDSKKRSS